MDKYRIVFQGLSEGVHEFEFEVDDLFFENLEYSDIKKGNLNAKVLLTKRTQFLELRFSINGYVELICDRCLDEYDQPVKYRGTLFVKFSENEEQLAEDVICLLPADHELDIAHYLYESIKLSIPLKRVHPKDKGNITCNQEMLKNLDKYYKKGHSIESGNDPRWSDLGKLMGNNN